MKKPGKKYSHLKTAIIAGVVLFSLMVPQIAWAQSPGAVKFLFEQVAGLFKTGTQMTAMAIGESVIVAVSGFVFGLLNLLVKLGGLTFEAMLKIGFQSHLDIVKAGWGVTRDFSNMLFILFMVVVAFTTILRTEKYGIKQLLPKVILIALLINFSYVISAAIIDFSNITANFFIDETRKSIRGQGGISGKLSDSLNLTGIYMSLDCDKFSDDPEEGGKSAQEKCFEAMASKFSASIVTLIISITMGSLVMLITAFVFFAGAILLLIRIVIVWFLIMIVPFVFICYIMPGLRSNWQRWWKTFLQWCFFAPAYAFFIWLAVKVAAEGKTEIMAKKLSTEFTDTGALMNAFTSSPALIIHYLFIIALLLGGLIAASKMGIYGASVAMKVGQGIYRGAGRWTGARIRERAARPMEAISKGMAKVSRYFPPLRPLAKLPVKTIAAQRKAIEEEKKKLSVHSPATLKSLYPALTRTGKIAATQLMSDKGKFSAGGNLRKRDLERVIKVANIYGKDMAAPMLTNRPDLAPAIGETKEETIKKISPAKADKIQTESFKDPETLEFMIKNFTGAHAAKIAESNIEGANLIQEAITELGDTVRERSLNLLGLNDRLAKYISRSSAQGTGFYTFD